MDEPTANLDPKSRRQLITLLRSFDHTLLLATHDMDLAAELCRRIVILSQGEIMADGSAEEIFLNKELLESCSLEQPYAYR
jgi:cobalt/nickel transport system ATP-binding protein